MQGLYQDISVVPLIMSVVSGNNELWMLCDARAQHMTARGWLDAHNKELNSRFLRGAEVGSNAAVVPRHMCCHQTLLQELDK